MQKHATLINSFAVSEKLSHTYIYIKNIYTYIQRSCLKLLISIVNYKTYCGKQGMVSGSQKCLVIVKN